MPGQVRIRAGAGEGVVLSGDERPFHDVLMRPAAPRDTQASVGGTSGLAPLSSSSCRGWKLAGAWGHCRLVGAWRALRHRS
jgi:hypothetical protein